MGVASEHAAAGPQTVMRAAAPQDVPLRSWLGWPANRRLVRVGCVGSLLAAPS